MRFASDEGRPRCKGLFRQVSKNPRRVAERLGRGGRVIKMMEQTIHHHEIERVIFFEFLPVVLAMLENS